MTVTPSARLVTCMRCRDTGPAAASDAAICSMLAPHCRATAPAHSALVTWCSPYTPRCTSASRAPRASIACRVKRGLANSSNDTPSAQTSLGPDSVWLVRLTRTTQPELTYAIAATDGSSTLRITTPDGGMACGSSDLVCAMASREPNSPRCAVPTLSTTPIAGGAIAASAAMLPG